MAIEKTTGLVIRAVDFSETSKILTFFTSDLGKVKALAKGGRRLKSNFEVALDLLSVCRICVLRKPSAELDLLTEALLAERFPRLHSDLKALYAAYYMAEILDGVLAVGEPHGALFDATLASLRRLGEGDVRLELVRFQATLLSDLGFGFNLDECASCGGPVALAKRMAVSFNAGGILCSNCSGIVPDRISVQGGTIRTLKTLAEADETTIRRLSIAPATMWELWETTSGSICHLLGRRPKSAALLEW